MNTEVPKLVRWLKSAREDVDEIAGRIALDNPVAAERWSDEIYDKAAKLADGPYIGAPLERYRNARYLVHGNYVIYHTVHPDEVVIRAVRHGAQRFRRKWLRREE